VSFAERISHRHGESATALEARPQHAKCNTAFLKVQDYLSCYRSIFMLLGHQILLESDPCHDFATNDHCCVRCKCFQCGRNCQSLTDALAQESHNVLTYLGSAVV
jgi:hypothetical protein